MNKRHSHARRRPHSPWTIAAAAATLANRVAACVFVAWLTGGRALGDEIVVTPAGAKVKLEHVLHPGGVVEDYYEYAEPSGRHVKHGLYKRYYRNGDMRELITYAHGVEHGPFIVWQDGNVKALEGRYDHGRLDGTITRYYPSGVKQREFHYERGELDGPFVTYHENGVVQAIGTHRQGQKHGPYAEYHANGKLYLEGTYERGYLKGKITLYTESGVPEATGELRKERIAGGWVCLAHEGRPARQRPDCKGKMFWECPCD
jgi:hypothetical protein